VGVRAATLIAVLAAAWALPAAAQPQPGGSPFGNPFPPAFSTAPAAGVPPAVSTAPALALGQTQ
jgi:hypothetical protein